MDKKAKAEAKRARRNQRKLELTGDANQDVELNTPETDSTDSGDSESGQL